VQSRSRNTIRKEEASPSMGTSVVCKSAAAVSVTGSRQSPIDIRTDSCSCNKSRKPALYFDYPEILSGLPITNTGYGWTVEIPSPKKACIEDGPLQGKYILEQFHAHWGSDCSCGSEHTIDGKSYPAEVRIQLRKECKE